MKSYELFGAPQLVEKRRIRLIRRPIDLRKRFNPEEPRDERGRWTTGGELRAPQVGRNDRASDVSRGAQESSLPTIKGQYEHGRRCKSGGDRRALALVYERRN